jgi:hypothetical protein
MIISMVSFQKVLSDQKFSTFGSVFQTFNNLLYRVDNDPGNRITNITWEKDGNPITVSSEDRIDFGMDGSVTVANVQKRHGGIYRCTATTGKYSLLTYLIGVSIKKSEKLVLYFNVQKCHFLDIV